jgi:beta-xylosidase
MHRDFEISNVRIEVIANPGGEHEDSIPPGYSGNPIIRDIFTADPCAMVYNDTLYLFTGHDEQNTVSEWFYIRDWHVFSTTDMINYTDHGAKLAYTDFSWSSGNAFAGHCIYKNGKFWWYVPMTHKTIKVHEGFAIGVASADHPTGPYADVLGKALITDDTYNSADLNIDPAVFIDDDGQVYLFWGSWGACRMVKLNDNMIDLDSDVQVVNVPNFFEAPWIHKRNGIYYLTYASLYPSVIAYSTSASINGPWIYRGVLNDYVENCETNHPSIIQYKGNWYFFYHNGALPTGGNWRRSVCVELLYYDEDGLMKKIVQTTAGVPGIVAGTEKTGAVTDFQFKVFPNPINGNKLNIEFPEVSLTKTIEISITDIGGRLIYRGIINGSNEIELTESPAPGCYFIAIKCGISPGSSLLMVTGR